VTEDCRRAAMALGVGELLCGPDFSLYEAMSALELMDPKMDEALREVSEQVMRPAGRPGEINRSTAGVLNMGRRMRAPHRTAVWRAHLDDDDSNTSQQET